MSPLDLPIRRPVATAVFFVAVVLVGVVGWRQIPVELFPSLSGSLLHVAFNRPGSEPEVVEREILLPLEERVSTLAGVAETWGEVRGSHGSLDVRFERWVDLKVRQLELGQLASDLARAQPRGTSIDVRAQDTSVLSRFVMVVQVAGGDDRFALHDFVEERIAPRLGAVPGVSQVLVGGGAGRQVTVRIDPDRCAAVGVTPEEVIAALRRSLGRLRFVGGLEDEAGRTSVLVDGRPAGVVSLGELRVTADRPVLLRHVAAIERGPGREQLLFRVNGGPAVGLIVFQDEGANLVRLGRALRRELDRLGAEVRPLGLELIVSFDGADLVEQQIRRLERLALSGFAIALLVLYLFLRQWRAVAVVGVAVPVSLLSAVALLYLGGQSFNLITLFGLAVGIGMLVDNSVVVYEAVQRRLEHGADADRAAVLGVRHTARAIVAASVTNAVVFLPLALTDFEDALVRSLVEITAVSILLPLLGSLLVAVGLVPLLAHRLAAPAALRRVAARRERRRQLGGLAPPDRLRGLFSGVVSAALRRPSGWLAGSAGAVLATAIVALPWVAINTAAEPPREVDDVQLTVRLPSDTSLAAAGEIFTHLEEAAQALDGVERVESTIQESAAQGVGGSLTVRLAALAERPPRLTAARVREVVRGAAKELGGKLGKEVEVLLPGEGEGGGGRQGGGQGGVAGLVGQDPARVVISGSDNAEIADLAREVAGRLRSIPQVDSVQLSQRPGLDELRVVPDRDRLAAFGLTADQVLPVLRLVGREGIELPIGFTLASGRELPLVVRRDAPPRESLADLARLRLATPAGVLPVASLATFRRVPPETVLEHHNGRRETSVSYRLAAAAPATGPSRLALEERIAAAVRDLHHPAETTVDVDKGEETTSWFRRLLLPAVLLLYGVLAMTFESLTLPVLVLLALPLTLLGSTWALALAGLPLDVMALVGALALLGLTVNPAILLVDRMQRRLRHGGGTAGAAALVAVRERARPVLMTTATTVAGLWPLALVTGRENEIWPPFATIVIGGLATSTLLTLLVIPVGFVLLERLDRLFGRLGPWVVLGWIAATAAVVTPLVASGLLTTLVWQVTVTALVAASLLGAAVAGVWRPRLPEPAVAGGPPAVEVRHLRKVYGQPGPIGRAWRAPERFARRVLAAGGRAFDRREARERAVVFLWLAAGLGYLAATLSTPAWRLAYLFAAAAAAGRALLEVRRSRGRADAVGRVAPGGPEGVAAALLPWLAWGLFAYRSYLGPRLGGTTPEAGPLVIVVLAMLLALVQLGRRTARRVARGELRERPDAGPLRRARTAWRRLARRLFGLDLPRREVAALTGVNFRATRGMVGILGPNGAGKTTLLRQLAGVLEPSAGRILLGGVHLGRLRRYLARWVGYLPQDAALPGELTARQYLDYWAILYEIPAGERRERIDRLLTEVGLAERADERIGSYSGGMRQRVAVARTLLRLPPVIIVDEPTVGLDPRERIRFRDLLSRLARGRVVLFSTHVVEDVAVACERVIVLAGGRLVFDGPPAELTAVARGQLWQVSLTVEEVAGLPAEVQIADQVPEAGGRARLRLIAPEAPHPAARPVTPTLEEGYLMLVGEGGAG